jgi:hypothetical protein
MDPATVGIQTIFIVAGEGTYAATGEVTLQPVLELQRNNYGNQLHDKSAKLVDFSTLPLHYQR